jgi:hypothetical protein
MPSTRPALSVVLVTLDGLAPVRRTIERLRDQTARDRLELVVVGGDPRPAEAAELEAEGFAATRMVPLREIESWGRAAAEGARRASAPVVVFAEEHSYPRPGWAQALIDAHEGPHAAVGPALYNANPNSVVSWAHFLGSFGSWVAPEPGVKARLPWHHTAYKRDLLLRYGPDLPAMLEVEGRLHEELVAEGRTLYLASAAVSDHVNVSRPSSQLVIDFNGGRLLGGARARRWGPARRGLYVLATPAILLLRVRRAFADLRRVSALCSVPRLVGPWLLLGVAASVAGEAAGYVGGLGRAPEQRLDMEVHRDRYRGRERRRQG